MAPLRGRRTPPQSLDVHLDHAPALRRPGDRVLDVGAGPGRFTIELARLGAEVTVADISPRQLELNAEKVAATGLEERVRARVLADVTDLSPLRRRELRRGRLLRRAAQLRVDRAEDGVAELVRVTGPAVTYSSR